MALAEDLGLSSSENLNANLSTSTDQAEFIAFGDPRDPYAVLLADKKSSFPQLYQDLRSTRLNAQESLVRITLPRPLNNSVVGWYLAKERRHPVVTRFIFQDGQLRTEKTLLGSNENVITIAIPERATLQWKKTSEPFLVAPKFVAHWAKSGSGAYALLLDFLSTMQNQFQDSPGFLKGSALDAVATNVVVISASSYSLFDQEWAYTKPLPTSYFVLRNLLALSWHSRTKRLPVRQWYFRICEDLKVSPNLSEDLLFERDIQRATSINPIPDGPPDLLLALFSPVHKTLGDGIKSWVKNLCGLSLR